MPHGPQHAHLAVRAELRPSVRAFDMYSAYYREGLRRYLATSGGHYEEVTLERHAPIVRGVRRVRDAYRLRGFFARLPRLGRALDVLVDRIVAAPPADGLRPGGPHKLVFSGRDSRQLRVCIDSNDDRDVAPEPLAWCDLYLKTNYWPSVTYPEKVRCLANADPLVIPQLDTMRAGRTAAKEYDVSMIVRVWGGRDEVEGVEHNLRLIEAVNRGPGRKFLYAYLVAGDIERARERLGAQGIPCGTDPIPAAKLWSVTAASRLNVIRLGMHYCIPWRFTGALAIGSAIVLDRRPFTLWPEPLREGENFLSLDVETSSEQPLAPASRYEEVPRKLEAWLADPALAARIGESNARYYDRFVEPEAMGKQIVASVLAAAPDLLD